MAGGRKKKPDHLKVLSGTAQPCRMNPEQPVASSGVASAPEWLSERAAEIFSRLCTTLEVMGIASPVDVDNLSMLAKRLEDIEVLTVQIEDSGHTYKTDAGLFEGQSGSGAAERGDASRAVSAC